VCTGEDTSTPVNRRAALFLLLYTVVILYLSLYPWRFVSYMGSRTLVWIPLYSRRMVVDAFLNVAFYMPLGGAAVLSFRRRGVGAFVAALAFGALISLTVELAQTSIPSRFGNLTDLACNSAGTLLGIVLALVAISPPVASRLRSLHSPGVLMLGLWAIWQAFLFLPRYGPTIDLSHVAVGVVVLALCLFPRPIRAAVPLLLLWLAFEELRPFHFQGPPQPFGWLPFESWFGGAADSYYGPLFGKLFLYTAILCVERKSGMRWIWAFVTPGAILFAGELAQRYLPGRTPEITDVFLLAAGAVLLYLIEPSRWDNRDQA
jgi:VanZ family protein